MIKKLIGYFISVIGIFVLAIGILPPVRDSVKIIPATISNLSIIIVSMIIIAIGIFFLYKEGSSSKVSEVPIYHGKDVIGFRRLGKK